MLCRGTCSGKQSGRRGGLASAARGGSHVPGQVCVVALATPTATAIAHGCWQSTTAPGTGLQSGILLMGCQDDSPRRYSLFVVGAPATATSNSTALRSTATSRALRSSCPMGRVIVCTFCYCLVPSCGPIGHPTAFPYKHCCWAWPWICPLIQKAAGAQTGDSSIVHVLQRVCQSGTSRSVLPHALEHMPA